MSEGMRRHIPVIIAVTVIGIFTGAMLLMRVRDAAGSLNVSTFDSLIIIVPCAVMLIGSIVIAATANVIGRQLYITVMGICLITGVVSMLVTTSWVHDASIQAALLANSPENAVLVAPTDSPIIVLRDIAAYVVVATVGCIAGAWLGSRMHPMQSETGATKRSKSKKR